MAERKLRRPPSESDSDDDTNMKRAKIVENPKRFQSRDVNGGQGDDVFVRKPQNHVIESEDESEDEGGGASVIRSKLTFEIPPELLVPTSDEDNNELDGAGVNDEGGGRGVTNEFNGTEEAGKGSGGTLAEEVILTEGASGEYKFNGDDDTVWDPQNHNSYDDPSFVGAASVFEPGNEKNKEGGRGVTDEFYGTEEAGKGSGGTAAEEVSVSVVNEYGLLAWMKRAHQNYDWWVVRTDDQTFKSGGRTEFPGGLKRWGMWIIYVPECIGNKRWCCGLIDLHEKEFAYYNPSMVIDNNDENAQEFFEKAKKWVVANYRFTMSYVESWRCEAVEISRPVDESGVAVMYYMRIGDQMVALDVPIADARAMITEELNEARSPEVIVDNPIGNGAPGNKESDAVVVFSDSNSASDEDTSKKVVKRKRPIPRVGRAGIKRKVGTGSGGTPTPEVIEISSSDED